MKDWLLPFKLKSNRYSAALSQSLKGTKLRFGKKKYDCTSGIHLAHSGMFLKPFKSNLLNRSLNTISHCNDKKLLMLQNNAVKYKELIDACAGVFIFLGT